MIESFFPAPENLAPRQWRVVGPFPGEPSGERNLACDYLQGLGGEAAARLEDATVVPWQGQSFAVRVAPAAEHGIVDLLAHFGGDCDFKVAYAWAEWTEPRAGNWHVRFGSDDGAMVWLNGEPVHRFAGGRPLLPDDDGFDVAVRAGVNRLLVKVENGLGGWGFALRGFDAQGQERLRDRAWRRQLDSLDPGPVTGSFLLGHVFPAIVWRNESAARRVFGDAPLGVRWFDPDLRPADRPGPEGRYIAVVEATTRDGCPHRRMLTFAKVPPRVIPEAAVPVLPPRLPAPAWPLRALAGVPLSPAQEDELAAHAYRAMQGSLRHTEEGAIAMARVVELGAGTPAAREPAWLDSGVIRNAEQQLELRLQLDGRRPRPLAPPQRLDAPAQQLRAGTEAEAGLRPGTVERLRALCRERLQQDSNGFVVLVARRGVIAMHEGFGGLQPDSLFSPASCGKPVGALAFARAVDQGLLSLDQPVGDVLPAWRHEHTRDVTFRWCFTHVTGLREHHSHRGLFNPDLDNDLFAQDALFARPGRERVYNGDAYNLAGKALELVTGRPMWRILQEQFFGPLDAPASQYDLGFGNRYSALFMARFGQMLLQDGQYGGYRFFRPGFIEAELLPRRVQGFAPDLPDAQLEWGVGLEWMIDPPGARAQGVLGPNVFGHGSATACAWRMAPDRQLVAVIGRSEFGDYADAVAWNSRFMALLAQGLAEP